MSDLIDRQAAIDAVRKSYDEILDFYSDGHTVADSFEDILNALPSAQPQPKTGKWIDKSGGIEGAWNYCSVCGEQAIDLYDYCPNCGAKMEEGEKNELGLQNQYDIDRARLEHVPALIRIPLLTCKDCEFWETGWSCGGDFHYCAMADDTHGPDFYCGYAEPRKDKDGD